MFWGLVLEAGKRYSQEVVKSFHVSMASLEINANSDGDQETVPVMLEYGDGREFLLCNLHKERNMQCKLDLSFKAGEQIGFFSASGKSRVHLTGYLEEEFQELSDEGEEEEEDEEDEVEAETSLLSESTKRTLSSSKGSAMKKQKLTVSEDSDEEEEEDDDYEILAEESEGEDEDSEEEEDDNITPVKKKVNESLQKKKVSDNLKGNKPKHMEGKESVLQKGNDTLCKSINESQDKKGTDSKTPNEKQKKKENLNQTPKTPVQKQNGQVKTPQSKKGKETPQKELHGGVIIKDKVVGKGPMAKKGSKVTVYYVGRLKKNNKQFDATTSGAGFTFSLGRGEVIEGWDIGVAGMKLGGVRNITIPSNLAYGIRGQPPVIPPNSDLTFEVELRGIR